MSGLRKRFDDVITDLSYLGGKPSREVLDPLRERVDALDHELQSVADPGEHYELSKLSAQANKTLTDGYARVEISLNVARAAYQRQLHDALHPTVLSPERPTLGEGWSILDEFER
ncbi:hypothetical protein [Nocardia wallacei]|uniref:hypothetical protein n=1 Tax=Nocardia wallacei TaxID=480035 RepID=UPI002456100A|nr:hypothetical protein [Nocardia wallacei]